MILHGMIKKALIYLTVKIKLLNDCSNFLVSLDEDIAQFFRVLHVCWFGIGTVC